MIAALPGFGNSFKSGPLATDGHMAGGAGTATLGTYNNNLFYGANGSFTYEAIIQIPAKNPSDGQGMILGRDGQNGSRGWDLKLGPTANTLEFRPCLVGNYDSPLGFSAPNPTLGLYGLQVEGIMPLPLTVDAGVDKDVSSGSPATLGGTPPPAEEAATSATVGLQARIWMTRR